MNDTLNDEYLTRKERLAQIRKQGINSYRERFERSHPVSEAVALPPSTPVSIAGRIMTTRDMGNIVFAHVADATGRVQLVLKKDELGKEQMAFFVKYTDAGDFIGVTGEMFTTQKGEISVLVKTFTLLSKSLRPLPDKYHGLKDQEAIYRQRYLDLISNRETYERFLFRSEFIKALRQFYWDNGFVEVETPILTNTASGALAKPFKTHHNAMDMDVFLRIAPETYLKEAVIGGFEKVFEIGRIFRNEGMDPSHLQDFTEAEHYVAYWNFEDNMRFTETMFETLLTKLFGTTEVTIKDRNGKSVKVNFKPPFPRVSFRDLIKKDSGIDIDDHKTVESLRKAIQTKKIKLEGAENLGRGNLIDVLYKTVSRDKLVQPTFIVNHPVDVSPLARRNDENPDIVDRFQLVVNTWEIINAYSELIDPIDQAERFEAQAKAKSTGDDEAHGKDEEFVRALEHGAPPMSGWGMGIDRIVTLLTQQDNLRDVVLFPLLKPENHDE